LVPLKPPLFFHFTLQIIISKATNNKELFYLEKCERLSKFSVNFFKPNVKSMLPGLRKPFIKKQVKEDILSFPIERPPIIKNFFIWKNVKDSLQAAEKFCRDLATQE
jgi:hypothetical protein